jgi:fibro-slime domain-containing protein
MSLLLVFRGARCSASILVWIALAPLGACAFQVKGNEPAAGSGGAASGGKTAGDSGDSGNSGNSGNSTELHLIIRDFKHYSAADASTNLDFENVPQTDALGYPSPGYVGPWPDAAIVAGALDSDGKPRYARPSGATLTTHGAAAFAQWYRDIPGTNIRVDYPLALIAGSDGTYAYDSDVQGVLYDAGGSSRMFFPLDDGSPYTTAFGDQGDPHNYSFTVEAHTTFTYHGGETFHYRGDDDVFVYIDGKLVINLGGIHGPEDGQVDLDTLGLIRGNRYPLDFFFAERHKTGSNVLIETTLALAPSPIS